MSLNFRLISTIISSKSIWRPITFTKHDINLPNATCRIDSQSEKKKMLGTVLFPKTLSKTQNSRPQFVLCSSKTQSLQHTNYIRQWHFARVSPQPEM